MNERQKEAVDALLEGQMTNKEADCLIGCLWRGLEAVKAQAQESLARAVLAGEVGNIAYCRGHIQEIEAFDKALESHPYALKREQEVKAEKAVQALALLKKLGIS